MDDTLAMDEDEEIEEEADAEVDKVLFDLTNGKLGLAGPAETAPPVSDTCHSTLTLSYACRSKLRRRKWRTRRPSVSWSNIDNNSAVFSADNTSRTCTRVWL